MNEDKEMEQRCKIYNTTLTHCDCLGFKYRKTCKHVDYLNKKENEKSKELWDEVEVTDGVDAQDFADYYGEDLIKEMKKIGKIIERKGKLYNL